MRSTPLVALCVLSCGATEFGHELEFSPGPGIVRLPQAGGSQQGTYITVLVADGLVSVEPPPMFYEWSQLDFAGMAADFITIVLGAGNTELGRFGIDIAPAVENPSIQTGHAIIPEILGATKLVLQNDAGEIVDSWDAASAESPGELRLDWRGPDHAILIWSPSADADATDIVQYQGVDEWQTISFVSPSSAVLLLTNLGSGSGSATCSYRVIRTRFQDYKTSRLDGNLDLDEFGDACDADADGDGILDFDDPCISAAGCPGADGGPVDGAPRGDVVELDGDGGESAPTHPISHPGGCNNCMASDSPGFEAVLLFLVVAMVRWRRPMMGVRERKTPSS